MISFCPLSAQDDIPQKEKLAADTVARLVDQTRSQNGLPRLRRIDDHYLRADACQRAQKGEAIGHSTGIGPPEKVGMMAVLWYSTANPNHSEPELLRLAKGSDRQYEQPHRFAVGVCVVPKNGTAEERYWIEVGTYMGAVKSFFYRAVWD